MGRPKLKNPRTVVIRFRVTPRQAAQLKKDAKKYGFPPADYIRDRMGLA
jgi:hypothetical protein